MAVKEKPRALRVEDVMPDKIYEVPAAWAKRAYIDEAKYRAMYGRSIKDPNAFWGEEGRTNSLVPARSSPREGYVVRSA